MKKELSLNTQKTQFMVIRSKFNGAQKQNRPDVFINNQKIEKVGKCKFDEHLHLLPIRYQHKNIKKQYLLIRMSRHLSKWYEMTIIKQVYCTTIISQC